MPQSRRLYFAYGSNMCLAQMAARCPASSPVGVATLPGWRFQISGDGYATLTAEPAAEVHGLVWDLDTQDETVLDQYEEVADGMYRKDSVVLPGGSKALIYLAADRGTGAPQPGYLERIVAAAEAAGFPASYVAELSAWGAGNR